jgi:hypothetical protein
MVLQQTCNNVARRKLDVARQKKNRATYMPHLWAPRAHRCFPPPHDLFVAKLCRFTYLLTPVSPVAAFPSWIVPCWQTLASVAAMMPSCRGPPLGSTGFVVFARGPLAPTRGGRRPRGAQRCTPTRTHPHLARNDLWVRRAHPINVIGTCCMATTYIGGGVEGHVNHPCRHLLYGHVVLLKSVWVK